MIVSNSEMDTLTKCERMFFYSHGLGIQPKELSLSLEIGIFGHRLQKTFWKAILAGKTYAEAVTELNEIVLESVERPEVTKILRNAVAFIDWAYHEQGWRPLEVETVHFYRMTEDIDFGMTPDVVFQFTKGVNKNRQFVVDFKHVAQYWNENQMVGYQQVPKYIRFLNEHEKKYRISMGAVVMLNTRAAQGSNKNLFTVKWVNFNKAKMDRITVENYRLAHRIYELKSMPIPEMDLAVNRTVNHYTCKLCNFADVCNLDFLGKDSSKLMAVAYEQNEYSYEVEVVRDEH